MEVVVAILLMVGAVLCWTLNFVGLPGNWLVIGLTAIYAWFVRDTTALDVGWAVVLALVVLATVGELIEFAAGAVGVSRSGGSKRGAVLAVVGSLVGGVVGMFMGIGIPIPLVGSLLGAMLCGGLGALAGAVLGEHWKGRSLDESLRIGEAAFWSRLLGTLGKALFGVPMLLAILLALISARL